jgi:tRNA-specific 2-thiouridylase
MSAPPDIVVGVSGGVDSSVAALMLVRSGAAVAGLFMRNWAEDGDGECRAEDDRRDAVAVCGRLGIAFHTRDFSREYWDDVFTHFIDEYRAGRTPNPDVLCNREIKFKAFLNAAHELGAGAIATGHYARTTYSGGRWRLLRGRDAGKDQSYFLHQLGQRQLAATRFPIGDLEKTQVRRIALEAGLPTAAKKDSTGICFIGERDFRSFLGRYLPAQSGEIRSADGSALGTHAGVFYYTLGQREGLQIGGIRGRDGAPWYVVGKDVAHNVLYVDQGADSPNLCATWLRAGEPAWVAGAPPASDWQGTAKVRYRQTDVACAARLIDDGAALEVEFPEPQRAVTPGQSIVFYDGDECLGGAVIERTNAPIEMRLRGHAA